MKNKVVSKIFAIIGIISILLSVFAITVSADGGQIGNGVIEDFDGYTDLYTKPYADHGIPFETIYYGMAYRNMINTNGLSNNYTLDNVGVTYAPSANGGSAYTSDQYRRVELIPSAEIQYPYPDVGRGSVVAYYGSLNYGSSPSVWYNKPMTYRYDSFLVGKIVNDGYYSNGDFPVDAFDFAIEQVNDEGRDLIYTNSYVASSVEHRITNTRLSSSLIKTKNEDDDYLYFPTFISNYCLLPINPVGTDYYYQFYIRGYSVDENGLIEYVERTIKSSEDTQKYYHDFFSHQDVDYTNYSNSGISITDMTNFYDEAYGLVTNRLVLHSGDLVTDLVDTFEIDVVTDISFRFGYEIFHDNTILTDYYDAVNSYPIIGSSFYYYNVEPYTMAKHISSVREYDRNGYGQLGQASDFSLFWLGNALKGVFDVDLFGTFGIGDIMFCVIGIGIFIAFLKIFAGG